jgi:dehydrogenase/reductase SDR family member 7B
MMLQGKVVWITGASSGIGEALLYECIRRGAKVVASSNDSGELNRVIASTGADKERVLAAPFDLAETTAIGSLVAGVYEQTGVLHYLINLGGVSQRATIADTPLWLDRKIMEINYFGTIALSKAVLPYMVKQRFGHIVVTSSIAGRFGFPLRSAYSASKQALHGFIETLHLENLDNNVRGSVIIPGRVKTNISVNALDSQGNRHGKLDPGQAGGLSAEAAAKKILRGIRRNRREILIGRSEMIMLYIRRLLPWLFFRVAGKIKST